MAIFRVSKVVATLPATLTADTLYIVRVGDGFDLYCTDTTGNIAHTLNSTGDALNSIIEIDGGSASTTYLSGVQELDGGDARSFGVFPVADTADTDSETIAFGNVLLNDENTGFSALIVSAVNGLSANVGQIVAGSNGGDFVIYANGSWTFDPAGDFAALSGSDTAETSVTYHASDGQAEANATLTVTVTGVVQLWTPTAMTTLARWWDADGLAVGSVSSWPDKSGLGKHMTQATAAKMPYSTGTSVFTDGVDDELYADLTCLVGETYWVFYVVTLTASDLMFMLTSLNNVDRGLCQQFLRPNGVYWSHNSSGTDINISNVTPVLSVGDPVLTCYEYFGGVMRWWRDGVLWASLSTTKSLTTLVNGSLGRRAASPTNDDISMHEIIITNTRPDDALRQKIEGYAAHKWDKLLGKTKLVASLPADHQYKSAAPTL